jgi:hypothetical protein
VDISSKFINFGSVNSILSEWYKNITPEEEAQLAKDTAMERELRENNNLLKRKRKSTAGIPADSKRLKQETFKAAEGHTQEIASHLNFLQTTLGVHSLVVSGGGHRTTLAGSLFDSSLPYAKVFSETIMPIKEFQKKVEGIVKIAEGLEVCGITSKVAIGDKDDSNLNVRIKTAQDLRLKEIGEKLRELYGKGESISGLHHSLLTLSQIIGTATGSNLLQWDFSTKGESLPILTLQGNASLPPVKIDGWPANVRTLKPKSLKKEEQVRLLDALEKGLISMEVQSDIVSGIGDSQSRQR